jgi:hypothetical protein
MYEKYMDESGIEGRDNWRREGDEMKRKGIEFFSLERI